MTSKKPVCSRCGKESVLKKEWEEKIETGQGISIVKHQQFICPDKECQLAVEEGLLERKRVSAAREQAAKERDEERQQMRRKQEDSV